MIFAKRIILFLVVNFLVLFMISAFLELLHIQPYLTIYGLDMTSLLAFCFLWGMLGAFVSLALSRVSAKWMMQVKVVDEKTTDPQLLQWASVVRKLAHSAQIPVPEFGVYLSNEVNAFATGPTKSRSLIAVSSGLLKRMGDREIEAILGHEMAHIANGDMVTMTLLQGVVNAFVMFLSRVLAYAAAGFGKGRQEDSRGGSFLSYHLFVILFQTVFMLLGSLVIAAFSRYREFRADRGGAELAGKESMISALQSLRVLSDIKDNKEENPAIAAFKISRQSRKGLWQLFATHPPLEDRIERLNQEVI